MHDMLAHQKTTADTANVDLAFVEEVVKKHGGQRDRVIPILQALQNHYRYLPPAALHRVCELTERVGADISTVSKHLSILKQAGIVEDNKRGLQVWYRLKVPCILNFFGCVESVLKANATDLAKVISRK